MKYIAKMCIFFLLMLVVGSCSTVSKKYVAWWGQEAELRKFYRPTSEVVLIEANTVLPDYRFYFRSIDGRRITVPSCIYIETTPGPHAIQGIYGHVRTLARFTGFFTGFLDAKAGKFYRARVFAKQIYFTEVSNISDIKT